MELVGRMPHTIRLCVCFTFFLSVARAFYFPGVASKDFFELLQPLPWELSVKCQWHLLLLQWQLLLPRHFKPMLRRPKLIPQKTPLDQLIKKERLIPLKRLQVSNLSPLLNVDQLKQLFGFGGIVVECTNTDSKHFAYIEYSKPEEATVALALNNMEVGGCPLNVEMAKSLPPKPVLNSSMASSSLPLVMQQAVAMQQMQFEQALLMQQALTAQHAANRAATMKSATDLAAARAAEITKKMQADGLI